jgi:hypothetical protein
VSHSENQHQGRAEMSQMRQRSRGTAGSDSDEFGVWEFVVKKHSPLANNVIRKCFTHNPMLVSFSLVHSGRPTNGLHMKGTKIRCKCSLVTVNLLSPQKANAILQIMVTKLRIARVLMCGGMRLQPV